MTNRPVRLCFCRKSTRPWSEFEINFSQCNMRYFQRALVGSNKLIIFLPVPEEIIYSFFNFLFDVLEYYKFGLCITTWKQGFVSDHTFTSKRESHSVPGMGFLLTFNYFVPFGVIANRFTKTYFKCFNGICDNSSFPAWFFLVENNSVFICTTP